MLAARTVLHNLALGAMSVGRMVTAVPGSDKAGKLGYVLPFTPVP